MKPVFHYHTYMAFLDDYIAEKKSVNRYFSLAVWAKKLGFASAASLANIVNGRRPPSQATARKLCDSIGTLSGLERDFFMLLVELQRNSDHPELQDAIKKRMTLIKPSQSYIQIKDEQLAQISNWQAYAIREMVNLRDFEYNHNWISERLSPKINQEDVKKSVECLLAVGLLKKSADEKLSIQEALHESSSDVKSEAIQTYHRSVLKIAIEKIRTCPVDERHFTAGTISLQKKDLKAAKLFIKNFRREFVDQFDRPNGDEVYQINLQFFPLTQKK